MIRCPDVDPLMTPEAEGPPPDWQAGVRDLLAPHEAARQEAEERLALTLGVLYAPGLWFEGRAIGAKGRHGQRVAARRLLSADDPEQAAAWLADQACEARGDAAGVYVTLNPVRPGLDRPARDEDVTARRWLLIDIDAARPGECNATAAEKEAAWDLVCRVRDDLAGRGFPRPVIGDSGNGYHLLYRVDLPNDAAAADLLRRLLEALAALHDTPQARVDTKVWNASRLTKAYGTAVRKGRPTPDRPVRVSEVASAPPSPDPVPRELLERLAAEAPARPTPAQTFSGVPAARGAGPDSGHSAAGRGKLVRRARAYLGRLPPAVSGQGGHGQTFQAAVTLVRGFGLTEPEAWPLLVEYNGRCVPPWSEPDLRHKLRDAVERSTVPHGFLLTEADPTDPARLADTFLAGGVWRYWRDSFWRYDGGRYVEVEDGELRATLTAHIEAELKRAEDTWQARRDRLEGLARGKGQRGEQARRRLKALKPPRAARFGLPLLHNTLQLLRGRALVPSRAEMPCHLGGGPGHLLAVENGLLDPQTLALHPHTPDWFSGVRLPYPYTPGADCPKFKAFLRRVLGGDPGKEALLQEWFGYCLVPCTDAQAFLVLVGEGGNGKSAACAALEALLGPDNVSGVPLEAFAERFGLTPTLGKLANVCADLSELDRVAEGRLKQYTSGDLMAFDRKGKPPVQARPTARLTLSTNALPRFSDRSGGLRRRALVLPFTAAIPPAERVAGMDKPAYWVRSGELPGMLTWALVGLARLRSRGMRFAEPAACQQAKEEHLLGCNPARQFLLEHAAADPGGWAASGLLYADYREWCARTGRKPLCDSEFAKEIPRAFPRACKGNRKVDGRSVRGWHGLRRLAAGTDADAERAEADGHDG